MKAKFLLPTLVGLSLVACTAEDDFSQSAEMKQSAVTFTVEKDGAALDTRAELNGSVVNFELGDLISLYHGMSAFSGDDFEAGDIVAGQNAIFEGEGLDGALVFKTKSMVLDGGAVMVYPADTSFVNKAGEAITISVPSEQDANTKLFQPYMSEAFEIGEYVDNEDAEGNKNTAGYGRNYTVPLKKVGSLLQMTLVADNVGTINNIEGVDDVVIKSVEINAPATPFAESVKVTVTENVPVLVTNEASVAVADKKYTHMKAVTEVVTEETVDAIKTTDIADGIAYFTLLPQVAAPVAEEPAGQAEESGTTATAAPTSIVVYTSYGKVTVESDDFDATDATTYPLINTNADVHSNLADAISAIINGAWGENKVATSNFKGENTGASFKRQFTFDMKNLNMDGTEVETSKQLIDLLKVYNALGLKDKTEGNVTWTLKGTNDNFLMSGEALSKLIEVNTAKKIKLNINNNTVTLNDADATLAKLQNENVKFVFVRPADGVEVTQKPNVILGANLNWTIDQKLATTNIKTLTNKGALTLTNNTTGYTTALAVELINDGSMTIGSSKVTLGKFTSNAASTMTVAAGKTLYFGNAANLYGKVTNEGIMSANNGTVNNYGEIDNKFEVSVVEGTNGAFNNGGYIKNNGTSAVTYLTVNKAFKDFESDGVSGGTLSMVATYYIGVIELTNRNDQISIDGDKGYVKYTLKSDEANYAPAKGDKFNWLTINKTATVKLANSTDNVGGETVDYLEITGNPTNIECNDFEVVDLFVEGSMRLLAGNSMVATNVYVKDYILRAADALSGTQHTTYTPSTYPTPAQAVAYPGEIRTAK